jgi:CysZ protein
MRRAPPSFGASGARPESDAGRRHFALPVLAYGLLIADFVAVPVLNLLTPLFATALMARLHKRLA